MGATTFEVIASGPTLKDAFNYAKEEAAYIYGHGGYTGTIAEKHDVVDWTNLFHGFKGVADKTKVKIANNCTALNFDSSWAKKQIPSQYWGIAERIGKEVDDKWGPAGAIELTGAVAKKAKRNRGDRVWVIFGWASE